MKNKFLIGIIISLLVVICCSCGSSVQPTPVSEPDTNLESSAESPVIETNNSPAPEITEKQRKSTDENNSSQIVSNETTPQIEAIAEDESKDFTCILSVKCDTILDNITKFNKDKIHILPQDGVIFPETEVIFYPGESVFNVLVREMKRNKIHMEFEMTPIYETAYIRGIANIYEFDCGELSGWTYKVNNKSPNVGCSLYELKDSDKIEWIYTCG